MKIVHVCVLPVRLSDDQNGRWKQLQIDQSFVQIGVGEFLLRKIRLQLERSQTCLILDESHHRAEWIGYLEDVPQIRGIWQSEKEKVF